MSRFSDAVNAQIASEFAASQQYTAIAVHYDAGTLPQLAAHFYRQALEERNHAMMLVQYLLDTGATVAIPGVQEPQTVFADDRAPVELALEQERTVTAQIANLVQVAREENEHVGEQFLGWFLEEQREEVASMSALLSVVERAGAAQILLVEDYLSRTAAIASEPSGSRTACCRRRALARPGRRAGQGGLEPIEERDLGRLQPAARLVELEPLDPVDLGERPDDPRVRRPLQVEGVAHRRRRVEVSLRSEADHELARLLGDLDRARSAALRAACSRSPPRTRAERPRRAPHPARPRPSGSSSARGPS